MDPTLSAEIPSYDTWKAIATFLGLILTFIGLVWFKGRRQEELARNPPLKKN